MSFIGFEPNMSEAEKIISTLEMLGGINLNKYSGMSNSMVYYINKDNIIKTYDPCIQKEDITLFNIDDFWKKYHYKVNDIVMFEGHAVRIKKVSWNKHVGMVIYYFNTSKDTEFCATVDKLSPFTEIVDKEILDCIKQFEEPPKIVSVDFNETTCNERVELNLDNYEIVVEDGKTYAVWKGINYPKTYEEAVDVLCVDDDKEIKVASSYQDELNNLHTLLICRDAYWKMYDYWQPDWANNNQPKWTIYLSITKEITKGQYSQEDNIRSLLVFPTEKMRDMFYKNFLREIVICKSLLV